MASPEASIAAGLTSQDHYSRIRNLSLELCRTLAPEDCAIQSMPDVSPTKWHLAHTTWFFERFVLEHFDPAYRRFNDDWHYLFNSYYVTVGKMHARPQRGLLSRPTVAEIQEYRRYVDQHLQSLLSQRGGDQELQMRITLGLNHEQQHQELLLTDIKHVFSCNPLNPAVNAELMPPPTGETEPLGWQAGKAGIHSLGTDGADGFCFDNETPQHEVLLQEHRIATRLITNGEYREFVNSGAYREPSLWLSDGWSTIQQQGWQRPMYWSEDGEQEFTLAGMRPMAVHAPVTHLSYYEADAFARWAGARLPTEAEWEVAARDHAVAGNFLDSGFWHPAPGSGQWFGDCWEWTASSYSAYPGFKPLAGSLGEYNGKFMCNQMTVRGGSCVSSRDHLRATYRSFFYPDARWQFLGLRLAQDT